MKSEETILAAITEVVMASAAARKDLVQKLDECELHGGSRIVPGELIEEMVDLFKAERDADEQFAEVQRLGYPFARKPEFIKLREDWQERIGRSADLNQQIMRAMLHTLLGGKAIFEVGVESDIVES